MTKSENDGLKSLIIKPSDKGGNIILMNRSYYVDMARNLLEDRATYETLPNNPTVPYVQELKHLLQEGIDLGCINKDERDFMLDQTPTIATFYALPKVHKKKTPVPGRPIVSGTDNLTQGISNYVDVLLRPFVTGLRSYLKDTKDTLTKINGITVSDQTILASLDVESLYSNIQHELGLNAVKFFLDTKGVQFRRHNTFLLSLLKFILTHNYFLFEGKFYHQTNGTAMGTNCAPTYANLFMGWWEDQIVFVDTYDKYTDHILFWGRYIDDVLILWDGDSHLFIEFVSELNINSIGMKFTYEISPVELAFLDIKIRIDDLRQLQTDIYRKPTSTNSFLHWQSWHPPHLKVVYPLANTFEPEGIAQVKRSLKRNAIISTNGSEKEDTPKNH